jgi:hypothetical protein
MARDFEACAETTEAWMYVAMLCLMLRRLCPPPARRRAARLGYRHAMQDGVEAPSSSCTRWANQVNLGR